MKIPIAVIKGPNDTNITGVKECIKAGGYVEFRTDHPELSRNGSLHFTRFQKTLDAICEMGNGKDTCVILTCRAKSDLGFQLLPKAVRIKVMKQAITLSNYALNSGRVGKIMADVEGRYLFGTKDNTDTNAFIRFARDQGVSIIASWHYLDRVPVDEKIRIVNHLEKVYDRGFEVMKIAYGIQRVEEGEYLIRLIREMFGNHEDKRPAKMPGIAIMPCAKKGSGLSGEDIAKMRALIPSDLIYGTATDKALPGVPSITQVLKALGK